MKPYSVFTWPFKLSFVHSWDNKQRYGNYPPDLEQRVDHFLDKFTPKQSILFFYPNYDNPISGDDMQYLLLGCSVIAERPEKTYFPLSEDELNDWWSKGYNMIVCLVKTRVIYLNLVTASSTIWEADTVFQYYFRGK